MYMLERLSDFITIRSSQLWGSADRLGEQFAFPSRPLRSSRVNRSRVVVGPEREGRLYRQMPATFAPASHLKVAKQSGPALTMLVTTQEDEVDE